MILSALRSCRTFEEQIALLGTSNQQRHLRPQLSAVNIWSRNPNTIPEDLLFREREFALIKENEKNNLCFTQSRLGIRLHISTRTELTDFHLRELEANA